MRKKKAESCVDKNIMIDQANRIVGLKKEINALSVELEKYKSKEKESVDALTMAVKYADGLQKEAMMKYVTECERLRQYSRRWEKFIKTKILSGEAYADPAAVVNTLKGCAKELEGMVLRDFGVDISVSEYYSEEKAVKREEPDELTDSEIDELLERLKSRENII